jgi:glycosyltransferase involved in cell wall biosynthesis
VRLVQLAAYDGPYPGSTIPMVRAAALAAREHGWETEAVFAETARERPWLRSLQADGIRVRILERSSRRVLAGRLGALLAERPDEPTILHTHFTVYDVPAVLAARGRRDCAVVWHLHTPPEARPSVRARNLVKFSLYGRRVGAILCVAPHLAALVGRMAPRGRTRFFPNGIDTAEFAPTTAERREAARAELGVPDNGAVLAHLGWDWSVKGGDILLEAVHALREQGRPVVAITRAGDPEAAVADRDRLGLGDAVRVLGQVDRIQSVYEAADVFVSSSRKEGMPFAVLEALLSGVPVVASDIPGHALIADRFPGCRLVPGDPAGVARVIADVLDTDREELALQTSEGARLIRERMGLEAWTARLFELYGGLLPER